MKEKELTWKRAGVESIWMGVFDLNIHFSLFTRKKSEKAIADPVISMKKLLLGPTLSKTL